MSDDRVSYMKTYRAEQRKSGVRRVSVTLAKSEYERVVESASKYQERVTTHMKHLALASLDDRYLVPPDIRERLDSLTAIVRGIGNNLNQLARHSNEMRYFLDTEEVRLQLRRLEDEIHHFVNEPAKEGAP